MTIVASHAAPNPTIKTSSKYAVRLWIGSVASHSENAYAAAIDTMHCAISALGTREM